MAWELTQAGLEHRREIEQDIFYEKKPEPIGTRRADFVVEGKVLVDLKAIRRCTHGASLELPEGIQAGSRVVNQFWQ